MAIAKSGITGKVNMNKDWSEKNMELTDFENRVYSIVRKVPQGKVITYKKIAELLGSKNYARAVGNAMHKNPVPYTELACRMGFKKKQNVSKTENENFEPVPCHRVVTSSGKMGSNFGLGGPSVQQKMLESEGVTVENGKVNLDKYLACQISVSFL